MHFPAGWLNFGMRQLQSDSNPAAREIIDQISTPADPFLFGARKIIWIQQNRPGTGRIKTLGYQIMMAGREPPVNRLKGIAGLISIDIPYFAFESRQRQTGFKLPPKGSPADRQSGLQRARENQHLPISIPSPGPNKEIDRKTGRNLDSGQRLIATAWQRQR